MVQLRLETDAPDGASGLGPLGRGDVLVVRARVVPADADADGVGVGAVEELLQGLSGTLQEKASDSKSEFRLARYKCASNFERRIWKYGKPATSSIPTGVCSCSGNLPFFLLLRLLHSSV